MKVGLVIPWRSQPTRVLPFNAVVDWYTDNYEEISIYLADRKGVWNLSASRNDGVRMAQEDGCDVVIVNDADTIPEIKAVKEAVQEAYLDGYCHTPYTKYVMLSKRGTAQHLKSRIPLPRCEGKAYPTACSGTYIATPEMWFSIGGQDEKFTGWGYEDNAWHKAHEVILGRPSIRHQGSAYAFHHIDQDRSGPQYQSNKSLWGRYAETESPDLMLDLVKSTT